MRIEHAGEPDYVKMQAAFLPVYSSDFILELEVKGNIDLYGYWYFM